jgi:PAS domain S-box-containing protein
MTKGIPGEGQITDSKDIELNEGIRNLLKRMPDERTFWVKLLGAVHEPLFIVDENKEIIFYNKKAEEVTGFSAEEVIGKPCLVGIRCVNCLRECSLFKEGQLKFRNLEFVTKSGGIIKVVKNAEVFKDADGNVIGGVEIFRDVTSEVEHAQRLSREKETIERILNSIGDGVAAVNSEGTIIFANERMENITGFKPDYLVGKSVVALLGFKNADELEKPGFSEGVTRQIQTSDGRNPAIELTVLSLPDEDEGEETPGKIILLRRITPTERVKKVMREHHNYHGVISRSPAMIEIFNMVEAIADSDVTILIEGESGTGKEVLARAIHASSRRRDKPFNVVNCAVLNENLLESELFGHCKGAFTGAISDKVGRFELADGGTIFLDEIGEMPPSLQVKLLRFLQNHEFERVGELKTRKVDVRIIAATNRNLQDQIELGSFRDDLYYRLNVIPITIPPLRDRPEDIQLLAENFVTEFCEKHGKPTVIISDDVMMILRSHTWSGNVRELENALLHAITCCDSNRITIAHLPKYLRMPADRKGNGSVAAQTNTVEDMEKAAIIQALRECNFNRSKAAEKLGITRTTLWRKIKRYRLQR